MNWHKKLKVGDRVKVMRRSIGGEIYWNPLMNGAIGKVYTVLEISYSGNLRLNTKDDTTYNYLYPPKSVEKVVIKNQQLLFEFMEG